MKHIVYTRHTDGGVDICTPTKEVLAVMKTGGFWKDCGPAAVAVQILRQIKEGVSPLAATRFAQAVAYGGCDETEALEIIKERDCGHKGYGHVFLETEDLPQDRWFRDAWRLGHNSGQIFTDLEAARAVHWRRLQLAVEDENKRRARAFKAEKPLAIDADALRAEILAASCEDELRRVWPAGLPVQADA